MKLKRGKKHSISNRDDYLKGKAIRKSVSLIEEVVGVIKLTEEYGFDIWVFMDCYSRRIRYCFIWEESDE